MTDTQLDKLRTLWSMTKDLREELSGPERFALVSVEGVLKNVLQVSGGVAWDGIDDPEEFLGRK